jgi:hypothetical protein
VISGLESRLLLIHHALLTASLALRNTINNISLEEIKGYKDYGAKL